MFSTVCCNSILARIARVSRKGLVTQLLPMKRLPFGCICRGSANAGKRNGKRHPSTLLAKVLGFSSYHCGRRRSFSTPNAFGAARNYPNVSQREIDVIRSGGPAKPGCHVVVLTKT